MAIKPFYKQVTSSPGVHQNLLRAIVDGSCNERLLRVGAEWFWFIIRTCSIGAGLTAPGVSLGLWLALAATFTLGILFITDTFSAF